MAFSLVAAAERLAGALKPPLTITPPPAGIRFERDVEVRVRDGTRLRVNVFRPEASGRYPVMMCAHPYGKDNLPRRVGGRYLPPRNYRILRQPEPVTFSAWTSWEAPDPGYWVPRGYAMVNADLRGFGHSDGEGAPLSDQEEEDYYDLIEWAARQPWSSGRVGLNGVSYLAISQYKVAALRPPHLRAICPWEGLTDAYRDLARPGGVREDGLCPWTWRCCLRPRSFAGATSSGWTSRGSGSIPGTRCAASFRHATSRARRASVSCTVAAPSMHTCSCRSGPPPDPPQLDSSTRGSTSVKVLPAPPSEATSIEPPCSLASSCDR